MAQGLKRRCLGWARSNPNIARVPGWRQQLSRGAAAELWAAVESSGASRMLAHPNAQRQQQQAQPAAARHAKPRARQQAAATAAPPRGQGHGKQRRGRAKKDAPSFWHSAPVVDTMWDDDLQGLQDNLERQLERSHLVQYSLQNGIVCKKLQRP